MAEDIKNVTIIVDSRESRSGMAKTLGAIPGVSVESQELDCADYVLGQNKVGCERKAANDFAASIMDGRLFSQVELCRAQYETTIVIVEGDLRSIRSAIPQGALDGALSYLALLAGVQLMFSSDVAHTAALLHRMAIHTEHGLGYAIPLRVAKPKDEQTLKRYLVEGLPGVGPETARALLAKFGSPRAVFCASAEDLKTVKGVGPKTIDRILQTLNG